MDPIQILRVGLGNKAVQVPIFRIAFVGGADGEVAPGGFFTTEEGELGIAIDARLSVEDAQALIAREVEQNLATLEAFARRDGGHAPQSHAS